MKNFTLVDFLTERSSTASDAQSANRSHQTHCETSEPSKKKNQDYNQEINKKNYKSYTSVSKRRKKYSCLFTFYCTTQSAEVFQHELRNLSSKMRKVNFRQIGLANHSKSQIHWVKMFLTSAYHKKGTVLLFDFGHKDSNVVNQWRAATICAIQSLWCIQWNSDKDVKRSSFAEFWMSPASLQG